MLLFRSVEAAEPVHKEGARAQGERGRGDVAMMTFDPGDRETVVVM